MELDAYQSAPIFSPDDIETNQEKIKETQLWREHQRE
jgi:hypothetical protein